MGKRKKNSQEKGRTTEQSNSSYIGHSPHSYSGLDPMHNIQAASYMEGSFLRRLFTGQLRTQNPVYIVAMGIFGVGAIAPTFCAVIELISRANAQTVVHETVDRNGVVGLYVDSPMPFPTENLLCFVPIAIIGVGLLINLVTNIKRNGCD